MGRVARFKVYGDFDHANKATVEIDRDALLFTVRPFKRRKSHTLPLAEVARRVLYSCIAAEVREKLKNKKARKARVRTGLLR